VQEQVRSKVVKMELMCIFRLLQNRWRSIGAFIAADKDIIDYLKYNLRSQMFAKALPMIQTIGALKRLELLRNHPELKDKLWENVNALQNGLRRKDLILEIPILVLHQFTLKEVFQKRWLW
jgi:glycine C-acetyltransferase